MSESAKKRKSLWDAEEETPNSPDYQEWRGPKGDNAWKPKNDPGWSYGDNVTETKEPRQNYHYKNMSPAFDRWGRQGTSHSPDNGRTQSRRYPGRGRSRSRSRSPSPSQSRGKGEIRSRSRGRGEGRSWSKGKGESRSRSRSRGRDRVRGRNRSRSQDRGSTRGQNRSRSPPHNYKRDPYASGDRRSGPRMPSQVCRDFTEGKCRRGSDCRFFHSDVVNHRDIDHSEDNLAEKMGSRPEHGHSSRYAGTEGHGYQSRDKLPDMYHMEDELSRNQSRGTVICRDFVKGNCRWAASCKFSHDGSSSDNYGKGTRNATFNHGQDNQASGTGKSVCKYFAAGKCYKDNCRFSHDGPTPSNLEVSPLYDIGGHKFDDKKNWLNGPTWEDTERASDHVKTTGWDETVARKDSAVTVLADKNNDRLGHSFGNESRAWGSTETKFTNSDQERGVSPHKGTAGNFAALNASEPSVMQMFSHAQEVHPASQASVSQYMERTSAPVLGHNLNQEASGIILSATSTQPYGSSSYYVQPQGLTEDSIARTLGSDVPNDFLNSRDSLHQVHLPGQSFSGTGIDMSSEHFAVFNGTGQEANLFLPNPSDGHNQKEAPNLPEMLQLKVPSTVSNTVTSEQVDQMKTSPTHLMNNFEKELPEAQLQRAFNPSDPAVMVSSSQRVFNPSDPTVMVPSHPISSVHATYGQANPEMSVLDQYHPPGGIVLGQVTSGNNTIPPDNSSYLDRDTNKVPMQQMIQSSTDDPEPEKFNQIDRMKQQEKILFEETNGNNKLAAIESNNGQEKDHPGAVDVHGQVEEESGNKDEKAMRLFKNALIEFVKEILKPTWKEGRMSREVHKTIVKKVVDKVTGTIQGDHVPKTQEKIELYLSSSKAKLTKLVQAYVERLLKNDA